MTILSVNLNKIALLRNSRGRDFPNVVAFARKFIDLGVQGITIHPRPDERHIKRRDAFDLADFLVTKPGIELNIEGYPADDFLRLVEATRPAQCTLVPDAANQLTSDHGWNFHGDTEVVFEAVAQLKAWQVRPAVFLDPDPGQLEGAARSGAARIELYTEDYARAWGSPRQAEVLARYRDTAGQARTLGLGVNAGHDLDLANLADFLAIPEILEVSIGHALTVECIERGMADVIRRYLDICHG